MKGLTTRPLLMLTLASSLAGMPPAFADDDNNYEVWVSDQTNSKGFSAAADVGTYGGFLRVYNSKHLKMDPPVNLPLNLDVAEVFPNALLGTGANVVRLHGGLPTKLTFM